MCENKNCLTDILETILCLQTTKDNDCEINGCDKPYLGPTPTLICYNTRPISFFNCITGDAWSFPYTLGTTTGTSSVFRLENLEGNCCTCRVLATNPDTSSNEPYVLTNTFFTINLGCVSAIRCLQDTFISGV
ncbi:MAG TPA: hypothetical protein IAB45_02460 [Candidatus Onthousia faecavium]|nr:hypothetical protein [Candidatus Onthousia faecavium]